MKIEADVTLDATKVSCPLPILKTKEKMAEMNLGEIIAVHTTDPGTKVDLIAWSDESNETYLGTFEQDDHSIHYIKKSLKETVTHKKGKIIPLDSLESEIKRTNGILIDVREKEEYDNGHIVNAISMPLGEMRERASTLDENKHMFVICRSGNRSGMAQKILEDNGIENAYNIVPGMQGWTGDIKTSNGGQSE